MGDYKVSVEFKFRDDNEWQGGDNVRVKGYAFDSSGNLLSGRELAMLFIDICTPDDLLCLAQKLNGLFCVVGVSPFGAFAMTDRIRSFPLFYTYKFGKLAVSDNPYGLVDRPIMGSVSDLEFKTAGYTLGKFTLYEDVFQVEAATFIYIKNSSVSIVEYFDYTTKHSEKKDYSVAKRELKAALDRSMQRMVKSVGNKPIAIPLSGGYDSRFILAWLTLNGYKDIVAFSYGRKRNPDMMLAERVAKKLNVQCFCLPYDEIVSELSDDNLLEDYVLYASNASSMPFFQDYPAIKKIREQKLIPSNSVIVPGHSGDFIAGSHLMPSDIDKTSLQLVHDIFNIHHIYYKASNDDKKEVVKGHSEFFSNYSQSIPYSILEWWNFKERQAKFIVNSCRAYQFFGYDIRLPFFDTELIEVFRTMPFEYKLFKKIYKEVLEEFYFKPIGVSFDDELQPTPLDYKKKIVKQYLKDTFPFMKRFSKQKDFLCYTEIGCLLFKRYRYLPDYQYRNELLCSPIIDWYMNFIKKKS